MEAATALEDPGMNWTLIPLIIVILGQLGNFMFPRTIYENDHSLYFLKDLGNLERGLEFRNFIKRGLLKESEATEMVKDWKLLPQRIKRQQNGNFIKGQQMYQTTWMLETECQNFMLSWRKKALLQVHEATLREVLKCHSTSGLDKRTFLWRISVPDNLY